MNLHFELAGPYRDQVYALALTEHFGHVLIPHCLTEVGDWRDVQDPTSFQAIGLLQQHPAFTSQWYGKGSFAVGVGDSQTEAQIKAAASYLEVMVDELGLDGAIQAYNKGVAAYRNGARNEVYLNRFSEALNRIRGLVNK